MRLASALARTLLTVLGLVAVYDGSRLILVIMLGVFWLALELVAFTSPVITPRIQRRRRP